MEIFEKMQNEQTYVTNWKSLRLQKFQQETKENLKEVIDDMEIIDFEFSESDASDDGLIEIKIKGKL